MKQFLIFTDLDGTLLDHHDYSWSDAEPALKTIREHGFPLILSSSKTAPEIFGLRESLQNSHPFIVENGGAVGFSREYFRGKLTDSEHHYEWMHFGSEYSDIVSELGKIREETGYRFLGFNDMDAGQVSEATGLSVDEAHNAKNRQSSEPLIWQDRENLINPFRLRLQHAGLTLTRGGRFYHVAGKTDKATGVQWLTDRFHTCWPKRRYVTVALGDGPNDRSMLEAVDIAVVIKPAQGEGMHLETGNQVIYADQPGPKGWCSAMTKVLREGLNG